MGNSVRKMSRGNWGSSSKDPPTTSADFKSLLERSISAWQTIHYVAPESPGLEKTTVINDHARTLRSYKTLEDVLERKGYWFFQLRESFLRQAVFLKWDPTRLDEYILLPVNYGFANNQDCFFVSHFWHTREHPDPEANDLVQLQHDLRGEDWSYVWIDWTCMPQVPRTEIQQKYFKRMLRYIPMVIRDCGLAWRFPDWEPGAWILMEVAEYVLNHKEHIRTDDNERFINHVFEMFVDGVRAVISRYGYKCTSQSDMNLVIGWLEVLVLLVKLMPDDVWKRHQTFDMINMPSIGSFSELSTGISIDKDKGIISYQGRNYRFTPLYRLALPE